MPLKAEQDPQEQVDDELQEEEEVSGGELSQKPIKIEFLSKNTTTTAIGEGKSQE